MVDGRCHLDENKNEDEDEDEVEDEDEDEDEDGNEEEWMDMFNSSPRLPLFWYPHLSLCPFLRHAPSTL